MSLINQMLKDLEKRTRSSGMPEINMSGAFPNNAFELFEESNHLTYIAGAVVFVTILGFFFYYTSTTTHTTSLHASAIENVVDVSKTTVIKSVPNPQPQPIAGDISSSILTGIALETQGNITSFRFLLNKDTLYTINTDSKKNTLQIIFDHTNVVTDLPSIDYLKSAIKGMEISNDKEGNLRVDISLNANVDVKSVDMSDSVNQEPELLIDFIANKPIATTSSTIMSSPELIQGFSKKPVESFNIEQQYKNAMNFSSLGQTKQAISILSDLTDAYPQFRLARESLIEILLQHDDKDSARKLLQIGLKQDPIHPPFLLLQARMLLDLGKTNQALEVLQKATPDIKSYPDYYAFIAALYQRQGKSDLSAKLYQQLLEVHPDKGMWWVGLAIALESRGSSAQAKEAYMRANNHSDDLSPEVKSFIQTQTSNL